MVTVVKRPTGHKLIDQAIAAEIIEDYVGDAVVQFPYHSLTTGDTVYIESDIDEYNGFWYVTVIDPNQFKISEHSLADFVEYYQDADIDYYQTQPHDWSSIFLPIVYKIKTDRWPINEIDSARTILSNSNDNGFTQLTLSGDIKSSGGGINALEFIKITGGTSDINGVWQIVEVFSNSDITIDLPYDSTNSFSGVVIQYYYNNYQVKVKIYGGLPATHPWEPKKPYEEVAELSLTPDENNEVMFSVSDYIQMKVQIKNNTLLYSLPLNLDAFTGFYISTSESFDDSDNYTITTNESSYQVDTFEGYAIAGKLPFKNTYSGDYADYILTSGSPALWLTSRQRLLAVEGYYFDVSFIKNIRGDFQIIINKQFGDYIAAETIDYTDQGIGVYRIPITPDATYDSFCIKAHTPGVPASEPAPPTTLADLASWVNATGAHAGTWALSATPDVSVNGGGYSSGYVSGAIATAAGYDYEFDVQLEIFGSGETPIIEVIFGLLDSSFNELDTVSFNYGSHSVQNPNFTLTSIGAGSYLGMRITNNTGSATKSFELQAASYTPTVPPDDGIPAQDLTEEICIDILDTCESLDQFVSEGIRLLEDGGYRLLE